MSEGDEAGKVHLDFIVEVGKVKLLWSAEIVVLHDSCVEEDAVDVGRLLHNPKRKTDVNRGLVLHLSWMSAHGTLLTRQQTEGSRPDC